MYEIYEACSTPLLWGISFFVTLIITGAEFPSAFSYVYNKKPYDGALFNIVIDHPVGFFCTAVFSWLWCTLGNKTILILFGVLSGQPQFIETLLSLLMFICPPFTYTCTFIAWYKYKKSW